MTGIPLIIAFIIAIIIMIVMISKLKIHPFLSIMLVALVFAMVAGIELVKIPDIIGDGFSSTFKSIGIVIILGALVGTLLEKTGAALKMADVVVKLVGKNHPEAAMLIMGWIVSIPVFCDSGFVILNPIRKALVKRTGRSSVASTVALSMGLYISHCFIPPTPGPIAAANTLYEQGLNIEANLLLVMGIGALASILPLIAGYAYAMFIGKKVRAKDEADMAQEGEVVKTYEELVASYGKLPSAFMSFAPIVIPIFLMGLASAFSMAGINVPIVTFLGKPIMALAVGVVFGVILLAQAGKMGEFHKLTDDTLKVTGPILFVTGAGGVLGKVIASTDLVPFIQANADSLSSLGLIFPFLIAAILKTAQGSSTVALTTTAGIVAPLLGTLGLATELGAALVTIAIGAGAMTVSHANDSYFWVVTNFGAMEVEDGYKTQTVGTLVIGIAAMINVLLISLIM
ncbi:MAG: GntP family permease [Christensenellales bacterium]|jgi:GntP family gluconate:H+ symporter|nr:GntP family permease [Christensenellaceae bacterium]